MALYISATHSFAVANDECVIRYPDAVFEDRYDDVWLDFEFGRRVISSIDNVKLNDFTSARRCLAMQGMTPENLCTGTKNLLVAKFNLAEDKRILLSRMGPNCYPFFLETCKEKDVKTVATFGFTFKDEEVLV